MLTMLVDSLSARLRRLEDREEIRQLLMNYGRYLDQRAFAAFSNLFADEEGEWIGGMGRAKGARSIRRLMEESIGKGSGGQKDFHIFTNETIEVDGDRATSTAKWMFIVPGESGRPQIMLMGHYDDRLIRKEGKWRFLSRTVYADIPPDTKPAARP